MSKISAPFTPEQEHEIDRLYLLGQSIDAIRRIFGCRDAKISTSLKNRGIVRSPVSRIKIILTDEQMATVKQMQATGHSQQDIANVIGESRQIIDRTYRELGLSPIPNGYVKNDEHLMDKIVKLHSLGDMSNNAIAKHLGLDRSTVDRRLKKLGITDFKHANNPQTFTPEQEARFLELRAKGWGVKALVKELGVNKRVIKRYITEHNSPAVPPPRAWEPKTHKVCTVCKEDRDICHFKVKYKETLLGIKGYYSSCCKDCHKLRHNISNSIRRHLLDLAAKGLANIKDGSCLDFLPYPLVDLKQHIEGMFSQPGNEWMGWHNWGVYRVETWNDNDTSTWTWHLDHIKPHCTFTYTSMEDVSFKECWDKNNLRPISAKQNILDNDKGARVGMFDTDGIDDEDEFDIEENYGGDFVSLNVEMI